MSIVENQPSNIYKNHKISVLMVNDQKMICEAVRRMLLGEEDLIFNFCLEASQAVQTAINVAPTVIIQDLIMPDIDGLTLVKQYRHTKETVYIPIIVLSSEENSQIKADAFALDANDYLTKIPDKIELLARLRHHSRGYIDRMESFSLYHEIIRKEKTGFMLLKQEEASFRVLDVNTAFLNITGSNINHAAVYNQMIEVYPASDAIKEILANTAASGNETETGNKLPEPWNNCRIYRLSSGELVVEKFF